MIQNQEPEQPGTAIVPAAESHPAPAIMAGPLMADFERSFGFQETIITLNKTGAYSADRGSTVVAFGPGALQIGRVANIFMTKPATLKINDEEHANPFYVLDEYGQPRLLWIRKIGIYLGRHGDIRYVDRTEQLDIEAYIVERVLKWKSDTPRNSARYATREQVRIWNDAASNADPGAPVYMFVAVSGDDLGIALNLNDPAGVDDLMADIAHMRKARMRRFETSSDRRIIASLIPESMTAFEFNIQQKQSSKGYSFYELEYARFRVDGPTKGGMLMGVLHQIARALSEDNAELRNRALQGFSDMTGIPLSDIRLMSIETPPEGTGDPEWEPETFGDGNLDPIPVMKKLSDLKEFVGSQFDKMDIDQRADFFKITGKESLPVKDKAAAIGAASANTELLIRKWFKAQCPAASMAEAKAMPAAEDPHKIAEDRRRRLLEASEGQAGERIDIILDELGIPPNTELTALSDEQIILIWQKFSGIR
jgi:hypothetical protein